MVLPHVTPIESQQDFFIEQNIKKTPTELPYIDIDATSKDVQQANEQTLRLGVVKEMTY